MWADQHSSDYVTDEQGQAQRARKQSTQQTGDDDQYEVRRNTHSSYFIANRQVVSALTR
jgi:hypothetical protein